MARKPVRVSPREAFFLLIAAVAVPVIFIEAFDAIFGLTIPLTFDTWFLAFLVGILAAILFIVIFLVFLLGGIRAFGPFGVVIGIASFFLLPLLYIFAFNFILNVNVPYTGDSYIMVGLTMIGVVLISAMIQSLGK